MHLNVSITMSLHYEKSDFGYRIEVLNPQSLSSIRGAYLARAPARKNTNAMQCSGMPEVVHCSLVIKQRNGTCFYAFV